MLCNNCLSEVYKVLNYSDLSVLYYLDAREKVIKDLINKHEQSKIFIPITSEKKIVESIKGVKNIRQIICFFVKLEIIKKTKKDHTWDYELTSTGKKIADMLKLDKKALDGVLKIVKGRV